jgi:hypothetical protein
MSRTRWSLLALALLLLPASAAAGVRWSEMGGHLSVGYGMLVIQDAPAGSISLAAGFDLPVAPALRAGFDVGYDLLGSRTVQGGSYFASVDYSAFQVAAFLHWLPPGGLVRRVSLGPALLGAHGDLSVTSGGAAFSPLAVHQTAGGVAAQVTLMSARPAPVKIGLELGARTGFLAGDDWTVLSARATVHY